MISENKGFSAERSANSRENRCRFVPPFFRPQLRGRLFQWIMLQQCWPFATELQPFKSIRTYPNLDANHGQHHVTPWIEILPIALGAPKTEKGFRRKSSRVGQGSLLGRLVGTLMVLLFEWQVMNLILKQ